MAAVLASDGPTLLHDVPDLVDVATLGQLLATLGVDVRRLGPAPEFPTVSDEPPAIADDPVAVHDRASAELPPDEPNVAFSFDDSQETADGLPAVSPLRLEVVNTTPCVADYELVRKMRAGICVLGPLLARRGHACVSLPGGCNIGDRPVDLHLKGLAALGAELRVERGYIFARAKRLRGARIYLGGPFGSTVTGTCNVMTAAALAHGVTTIEAAACEPEVVDLGNYLNRMGARISGLGTPFLHIEGVDHLTGCEHTIIPDRIEAATLMIAAAITLGDVVLENIAPDHMTAVIEKLRDIGVSVDLIGNSARVSVRDDLRPADCIMLPYPGLPTDVQAQMMALLTNVPGISIITDKIFPDRFMHVAELGRMGAAIRREGPSAIINGVPRLSGAAVMASDLRASAALVLAALSAQGDSVVRRIYHLDRGYDRLEQKLNDLGAAIARAQDIPLNMPASLSVNPAELLPAEENEHSLRGPKWLRRETLRIHSPENE
ncbi:MAG: UDP-N-acetylglucosamine 1-carboxyvinyltransferase [Planctomycetes bacterium]|nr:UDP-N-acetylglucosamine 1-carboxyvinyltransferase [Planctomycetota bacterium]